jgi:hypothetical protein
MRIARTLQGFLILLGSSKDRLGRDEFVLFTPWKSVGFLEFLCSTGNAWYEENFPQCRQNYKSRQSFRY